MPTSPRPSLADVRRVTQADVLARRSEEHWAGRLYMRRLSVRVTRFLVSRPAFDRVTPDGLTKLMIVVGLAAAVVVALAATWWAAVAALVLVQLYLLLDCVDGEVARWRKATSVRGVYLDRLGHHVVEAALVVALGARAAGGLLERGLLSSASAGWSPGGGWVEGGVVASVLAAWPWGGLLESGASWWLTLGAVAALLVVLAKAQTDLIVVARASAGRKLAPQADPTSSIGSVRSLRALFDWVPVHRLTGAVELSLVLVVAAVLDVVRGDLLATQLLTLVVGAVAVLVAVGHPVTILTSKRLR